MRLTRGDALSRLVRSPEIPNLDTLPFPRWDLIGVLPDGRRGTAFTRPLGAFSLLASRGCPEFCTYCPHRILAHYRARSVASVGKELAELCARYPEPFVVFRDPLFSQDRARVLAICDEIRARGLSLRF